MNMVQPVQQEPLDLLDLVIQATQVLPALRAGRGQLDPPAQLATPAQPLRSAKPDPAPAEAEATDKPIHPCPCCGSAMIIIEMFEAGSTPRNKPTTPVARRIDTS